MMIDTEDLVIRKEIQVGLPVERAFELFTAGIADWWPRETHSLANGQLTADWRVGGLIVEETSDGRFEWADVLELDPPSSFRLRWRVSPEKPPTEVAVSFAPAAGGTRIELVHSGWEVFADRADEEFQGYTSGWDAVLSQYVGRSER